MKSVECEFGYQRSPKFLKNKRFYLGILFALVVSIFIVLKFSYDDYTTKKNTSKVAVQITNCINNFDIQDKNKCYELLYINDFNRQLQIVEMVFLSKEFNDNVQLQKRLVMIAENKNFIKSGDKYSNPISQQSINEFRNEMLNNRKLLVE